MPDVVPASPSGFDEVSDDWWRLAGELPSSFFQTPLWGRAWWEAVGRPAGELAVWRVDGRPRALVALVESVVRVHPRVPVTVAVWQNLGGGAGAADHVGFLVADSLVDDVAAWLDDRWQGRSAYLRSFEDPALPLRLRSCRTIEVSRCPRLRLGAPEDRALVDVGFRKKLRYYRRRLAQADIDLEVRTGTDVDGRLLDRLYELNDERHAARGARTMLRADLRGLHDRLVADARPGSGPFAVVARSTADDSVVGVLYGFVWGATASYYNSGWTPEAAGLSVGTVLVDEALSWSRGNHLEVFDFLRGPEPYKYRFGATDDHDVTYLVPRGARGRLLAGRERLRSRRRADHSTEVAA